jgi:hypothetical protein
MRITRACLLLCTSLPLTAQAATVSVAGATFKVHRTQAALAARSVAIAAARNEFEAFQILITGPATGVTATATALSNGSASVGPVRLYREDLIKIAYQSAPDSIAAAGEYLPDALVPDVDELYGEKRNAFTGFNVASGETRAVWGEVRVPETAKAGTYTGSVTVRFAEGSAVVPITLTVYDFTLPTKPSLKSAFGLYYGGIPAGHGIAATSTTFAATRAKYDAFALDHRLSLSHHDDGDPSLTHFDATYAPYVAGTGATQTPAAALTSFEVEAGPTDTAGMKAWYDHFAAQGWADRLFQYTCDEPPQTCAWTDIPTRLAAAKAANPAFRTLVTTTLGEIADAEAQYGIGIQKNLEIVSPVVNQLWDKPGQRYAGSQWQTYSSFLASGPRKELWTYQSCMSHGCGGTSSYFTGWPSYAIDASATRNRAMQWLDFLYHASGELYFETVMAYSHDAWSNQWDFHGNGDGTFFYPGTPARIGGTTHIPVASIRLKLLREGMEDYEYLKMLSDLGDRAMAEREALTLFPTAYQTDASPDALMAARARIAQRIVELKNGATVPSYSAPYTPGVAVNGNASDLAGSKSIALSGASAGSDGTADVRLAYDDDYLYASWAVKDAAIVMNQTGRDGEIWNGDSVELFIDAANDKAATVDSNHYHLLVNANGDLTDERGNAGAWDRGWTSGALAAVARSTTGYTVELRVPWSSLGVSPCAGRTVGIDVAVNDVDAAGAAPKPFDWAGLSRFAQPNRWGNVTLSATFAGDVYLIQKASGTIAIDGSLAEFARAPLVSLDAAAAAKGSDNKAAARLLYDATNLYVAFKVSDAALRINQGGRDGETWNGDSVEVLLDLVGDRSAAPDADDRHLVVNASGDLTDEQGASGGWNRSWTSNAKVAVSGVPGSYSVEMAIPWSSLGVSSPAAGKVIGIDLANNDLDADGVLRQFDWAGLSRFAQPSLWKKARLDGRAPACTGSTTPAPAW